MSPLSVLERELLARLLSGSGADFEALRTQAGLAQVAGRQNTGVGFFVDIVVPEEVPVVQDCDSGTVGVLDAKSPVVEHGLGFLVFLRSGRLRLLECFSYAAEPVGELALDALRFREGARVEIKKYLTPPKT